MDFAHIILLIWTALVFWVLGQIWLAQLVIYPLFAQVGAAEYIAYHRLYSKRIPAPVIVPGFACFILPAALLFLGPEVPFWMNAVNVGAGLIGLLVTLLLEIPRHIRLARGGKDMLVISELIEFNWPRTLSITVQSAVSLAMTLQVFGDA